MFSRKRFAHLLLAGIAVLLIAFSTVYLVHYYGETRPTVAQVQAGRIHAVKIHERTVYLTRNEYGLAFATHAITVVAIGVFLGIVFKSKSTKK
jgi:hypothetical protein